MVIHFVFVFSHLRSRMRLLCNIKQVPLSLVLRNGKGNCLSTSNPTVTAHNFMKHFYSNCYSISYRENIQCLNMTIFKRNSSFCVTVTEKMHLFRSFSSCQPSTNAICNKNEINFFSIHKNFNTQCLYFISMRSMSDKTKIIESARNQSSHRNQKSAKQSIKEFNLKGKISAHDLDIKINKIKGILAKGKSVHVLLRSSHSSKVKIVSG